MKNWSTDLCPRKLAYIGRFPSICLTLLFLLLQTSLLEARKPVPKNEDLTQGGKPYDQSSFNLGPTGLRGWAYHFRASTAESRQILIKEVAKGSPADGIFEVGDVVLGVSGDGASPRNFQTDSRRAFADAITTAEARDPAILKLIRWRKGSSKHVELKLETMGAYSSTAPYDCPKSRKVLERGLQALYEANDPGTWSLGLLAFLAGDDASIPNNDQYQEKAKEWAHKMILSDEDIADLKSDRLRNQGKQAWNQSYHLLTLAEYFIKTQDQAVFPTLEAYAICFAKNQSWFGTTGHKFSDKRPDGGNNGPISGYGAINGSGVAGFYGMVLANGAGVDSPELPKAIKRSENFFASFRDKSGIPYGEHSYGTGGGMYDMNGKNSTAALAFSLLENRTKEAKFFGRMAMASSSDREHSHAGPYFNYVWPALGAASVGEKAVNHYLKRTAWLNDLDRRWDGKIVHSHYGHSPKYRNFPAEITTLLTCALPFRQLIMTGRAMNPYIQLSSTEIKETISAEDFDPGKATPTHLIDALKSWSPVVRHQTLRELKKTYSRPEAKALIVPGIHALLKDPEADRIQRAAACLAAGMIADDSAADLLAQKLLDEDSYVRFAAAYGLRYVSRTSQKKHLKTILEVTAKTIKPSFPIDDDDPLQFAHHQLAMLLFYNGNAYGPKGILSQSIEGIDRELLWPAVRAVAKTPAGQGRSTVGSIYNLLTEEEVKELGPSIVESVRLPAPADAMFAGGVRARGVDAMERYGFAEGLALSTTLVGRDAKHAAKILSQYGPSALSGETDILQFLLYRTATRGIDFNEAIKAVVSEKEPRKLSVLKEIRSITASPEILKIPQTEVELNVDGVNYTMGPKDTFYTWRKVFGAGPVSFTPNGNPQSSRTKVAFQNSKPGKYQFEVTMSDRLGYTTTQKTINIDLLGRDGKLPSENQPPKVEGLDVSVESGIPSPIYLKASDPEGEDLAYIIKDQPRNGTLTGQGQELNYTSNYGFTGSDSFTYRVIDGQGAEVLAKVKLQVQQEGVGVSIYEPFDYPVGSFHEIPTKGIGLTGAWEANSKKYVLSSGSYSYSSFPSKGNKVQSPAWGRNPHAICSISPDVLSDRGLFDHGGTLWFSFYLGMVGVNRTNGVMELGLMNREDPTSASIGVKLRTNQMKAVINGEIGSSEMPTRGGEIGMPSNKPHLILGKIKWGASSKDEDLIELYRVIDVENLGPTLLQKPISTLTGQIDQSLLNSLFFVYSERYVIDEIRVGSRYESVLLGTIPHE